MPSSWYAGCYNWTSDRSGQDSLSPRKKSTTNQASSDAPSPGLGASFAETLDKHGFGFQYAVMKHIQDLPEQQWVVDDIESPVLCNGKATHIDFVLGRKRSSLRIVAECKRPDTDRESDWLFVRTPFLRKNEQTFFEAVHARILGDGSTESVSTSLQTELRSDFGWPRQPPYGLGFPKGSGGNQTSLEKAIAQAFRGASGLIDRFGTVPFGRPALRVEERRGVIVPVIFTTARLWGSECDLRASDLHSGKAPRAGLKRLSWLWLRQNTSPELQHQLPVISPKEGDPESLAEWTLREFSRCVGIVSAGGIAEFLGHYEWSG